jgi:hypothetical protein
MFSPLLRDFRSCPDREREDEVTTDRAVIPLPTAARPWQALGNTSRALGLDTTPARLRMLLVGLVMLSLLWGAVAGWTAASHASAASEVVSVSEPLSLDAQRIYGALSDADATEAAAFLSGGLEPFSLRNQYQADIQQAAHELAAAAAAAGHSAAARRLATLAAGLPVYTGLIETARADNRLGLPLGAAYLREASAFMRTRLLPAARDLYAQENAELAAADQRATALPYLAALAALIVGLVLFLSQRWLARRTHRMVNPGLLLASAAVLASLSWLVSALAVGGSQLTAARDNGSAPVEALARADFAVLQAHADESLTLIDRSGDDSYQEDFVLLQRRLGPGPGTLLATAATAAANSPGGGLAAAAEREAPAWFAVHRRVRSLDDDGSYTAAVRLALRRGPDDSGGRFGRLDGELAGAISADQAYFQTAATAGQNDLGGLEAGMIALAVVAAGGCAFGISRRLAEYR